jgi:hypothetical protein
MSEDLAGKRLDSARELHGGGSAGGGDLEARAVELVLELAALLVASCAKVRQKSREIL